jgi:hypothetical protein
MNLPGIAHSVWGWLKWYYWGVVPQDGAAETIFLAEDAANVEPSITGEGLIGRILDTICLRRSALVTGPRGCGKSYCSDVAIRRSADLGIIGGWRFLQGNREIPRDTLSEDTLIINDAGKPELLHAIPLRPLNKSRWPDQRRAKHDAHVRKMKEEPFYPDGKPRFPDWPAIPTMACTRAEALDLWADDDWIVLYLDEINRFGDGFLDSLLSITEEGKLVRRGEDYFVPVTVVATANPPGYDVTAKKLSPPLQARIARSFRVAQPGFDDLVKVIIQPRLKDLAKQYNNQPGSHVPDDLARLAAAVTLCLWGDPGAGSQGSFFLTAATRRQLADVMRHDKVLRRAMKTLARKLISFGPDARAVQDWLGCAVGLAVSKNETFDAAHLRGTAVEVLGHKVREVFNEGAEPALSALKEYCVAEVTRCVLDNPDVREQFVPPLDGAARALAGAHATQDAVAEAAAQLTASQGQLPSSRYQPWLRALSRLPAVNGDLDGWVKKAVDLDALTRSEETREVVFFSAVEQKWVTDLLQPTRMDAMSRLQRIHVDPARLLDMLLEGQPVLGQFRPELAALVKDKQFTHLVADEVGQRAWRSALRDLLNPTSLEDATIDHALWRGLIGLVRPKEPDVRRRPKGALDLLHDTLHSVKGAANSVGRERCERILSRLSPLQELPLWEMAEHLAPQATEDLHARLVGAVLRIADDHREGLNTEGEFVARLSVWLQALSKLPLGSTNQPALLAGAQSAKALLTGQFVSPEEKEFAPALLVPVVAILQGDAALQPGATSVNTLDAVLRAVPFSPAPIVRSWVRLESGLRPDQRQAVEQDLLAALATITPSAAPHLAARLTNRDSCLNLVRRLGDLRKLGTPGASDTILAVWRTVHGIALTGPVDDFAVRTDEAVRLLKDTNLLGLAGQCPAGVAAQQALKDLESWNSGSLLKAGALLKKQDGKPVGPNNVLKFLIELLARLHATSYPLSGLLPVWLDLLPKAAAEKLKVNLPVILKPRLTDVNAFQTFVERAWLRQIGKLAPGVPLGEWADKQRFDFVAFADTQGRYPVAFVREALSVFEFEGCLNQQDSGALLAACLGVLDAVPETTADQAVRVAIAQMLQTGLVVEGTARKALRQGASAALSDPRCVRVLEVLDDVGIDLD